MTVNMEARNLSETKLRFEEDLESKEEPEEDPREGLEEVTGVSPITPPPLSYSLSESEFIAHVTTNRTHWVPPSSSTFEVGGPSYVSSLPPHLLGCEVKRLRDDTKSIYGTVRVLKRDATRTSDHVLALEEENRRLRRRVDSLKFSKTLAAMSQDMIKREFFSLRVWVNEILGGGVVGACPSESIDVLAVYGESRPQGRRDNQMVPSRFTFMFSSVMLLTMPPRRLRQRAVERLVVNRVAEAIAEYERNRTNPKNVGGAGNAGGAYEGVVRLSRWFEKMESLFEISKCVEEDKVKYVMCTLEGRALTWWNGNVHTLGISVANRIPWSDLKSMMTAEYCPGTKIQRMEQELKKIEHYVRGLLERVKGNVTSSKPANIHETINMARDLVEQAVQAKDTIIGESNKRK
ncbi:hypothetical protein Tco_0472838 [Tanacetum coccineum]